ncbi:MAG: MMPL family transporter [Desulfuromonadales bacterium]|nr:MMPL family transporter [Desulfuromonadales bacterium]
MTGNSWRDRLAAAIFRHRALILVFFLLATIGLGAAIARLRIDAGFDKMLPMQHPYMQTFAQYREAFGGANRILVVVMARDGDIFTPEYFDTLRKATDAVFFLPGIDRSRVRSLFTPNVRYTEVVEEGIAGDNVVPADFQPTPEGLARVRQNILKAGIVGRLVANDFRGALISAELLEVDPATGRKLDYLEVARQLEETIRQPFSDGRTSVHIIGFAQMIGDIAAGAKRVVLFFALTFLVTGALVFLYTRAHRVSALLLVCSLAAVVWQLGALTLFGYGIDPLGILVPFLIFAIAVSHGVQMITAVRAEIFAGATSLEAARNSFSRLLIPSGTALLTDLAGFVTILLIKVRVIQELAIAASLGVAAIILTNLLLLPILLSYVPFPDDYRQRLERRIESMDRFWLRAALLAKPWPAVAVLLVATMLAGYGWWRGAEVRIGDLQHGVPELRPDSRYNLDIATVTRHFSIGVDLLTVIAETPPDGCTDYSTMDTIDRFTWRLQNTPGVQSAIALPQVAKQLNTGWNEGNLKWQVLPRDRQTLVEAVQYIPTSSGLLNDNCSVMPVMLFTTDHKAETIDQVIAATEKFAAEEKDGPVRFRLASGNVGVMAATNQVVAAAQFPILIYVFGAIIALCLLTFRSLRATVSIVLPLGLVSLLGYALMAEIGIGLKVSTLPVVAFGVGIGVDYGIYIYSRFQAFLDEGQTIYNAYHETVKITGSGVLFTGITLAFGTATWIFSPLQFQADMGLLLTLLFLLNMLAALIVLPALASWLLRLGR